MNSPEENKPGCIKNDCGQIKVPEKQRPRVNLKGFNIFTRSVRDIKSKNKLQDERENFIKSTRETHLSNLPDKPPNLKSSNVPDKPIEANPSNVLDEVTKPTINNLNDQISLVANLPLELNQKKNVKWNHFENEDSKIRCRINNAFEKNCKAIGDNKDRKVEISVTNNNDVEKKVSTKFPTANTKLNYNRLIQTFQRNSLQPYSKVLPVEGNIKDVSNKNHFSEQDKKDIEEEDCGWPKLDIGKDQNRNYDNEDVWDDQKIHPLLHSPFVPVEGNIKGDSNKNHFSEQGTKDIEEKKFGWPKLDIEKDQNPSSCNDDVWNDHKIHSQLHSQFVSVGGSIKYDSNKKHISDDTKDYKQEECGWPKLDIGKDKKPTSGIEGVWDDNDSSIKDKRILTEERTRSYQRSTSMPYTQSKSATGGRNYSNSYEKENNWGVNRSQVRNDATVSKVARNYRDAPNRSYQGRSFNDDSGGCSGSSPHGGIKDSFSGSSKWNGFQPHRPNSELKRSKSLRDRNYGNEISKTNETLVKNRSFVNSQDSVHEVADSDSDSCAQVRRKNFYRKDENFTKSRSQDRKTMVYGPNEQINSGTAKWDKAWRDKINCSSLQMKDPKTCQELSNGNSDINLEITSSSTNREDDFWSTVSETSDASVIELDNCGKFETHHIVVPTGIIDLSTGRPSLKITCKFEDNHSKPETVSGGPQVIQEKSAYKNADELLNNIEGYSDPVEIFLQNCSASDIPAPRPVAAVVNETSESAVEQSSETSDYNSVSDLANVDSPTANNVLEHVPDSRQISEITSFLKEIEAEKSMPSNIADKVVRDVRNVIKYLSIKGYQVHLYGSYLSGLAVSTSNLNLALALHSDSYPKNPFLLQLQKEFTKKLPNYLVDPFEEEKNPKKSKICFTERDTGVSCELVYFGTHVSNHRKLSCVLEDVCQYDDRIKTLLIATRIWAEVCLINEPEEGKLHTSGFTLLMLHFLQKLDKPVLPIIDILSKNWGLEPLEIKNLSSVGELWLEFLKYYSSEFNWDHNVVTIHCKTTVLKSSKSWERSFIAIEDPFTQKNIADSVERHDCAECIKSCFKSSYQYFLSPAESEDSDTSDSDITGSQDCISKKGTYSFNNISLDQHLPSFCEECDELDELCGKCRPSKETFSQSFVEPLTKPSELSLSCVNTALHDVYKDYILPDDKIEGRKAFVRNLEKTVQEIYKSAKLTLFGSSVNGFGFKRSDLDICMTLDRKPMSDAEKSRILYSIVRHLRKKPLFYKNVFGLYYALIPIIKFKFVLQGWHCDLSLYNVLGVHNSTLLCKYALMDERCRILGCALKFLAKKASINDTALHTLSSYSYILMAIHYLQQVEPPVLPILPIENKEVFEDYLKVPSEVLNGHNYWFSEDVNALKRRYLPQPKNNSSVGELWLGLIDFLTRYDGTNAITITQKEPLPSASLQRCARLFNIEDPFLTKRNLGCILNNTGASTTLKVLGRARLLFGKEIPEERRCDPKQYLFSSSNLTGQFVKEMECLSCGGFGHEKADCEKDNPFKRCHKLGKPRPPYKRKV